MRRLFRCTGGERSKGSYSLNLGTWQIMALNTGGNDKCKPVWYGQGSEQENLLREGLGKSTSPCILAFWHRPLVTSGLNRNATEVKLFGRDLYQANADVILNGHSHHFEPLRFRIRTVLPIRNAASLNSSSAPEAET